MKRTVQLRVMVVALIAMLALVIPMTASAQTPAYQTSFTTSITYQNVGNASSSIQLDFYPENSGTSILLNQPALPAGAGASLFVGNVNGVTPAFRGSAVLSSSQPVVATLVQVAQGNASIRSFPLSNGFTADQGATSYRIPTILKQQFRFNSIVSIQNVDSAPVDVTIEFFNTATGASQYSTTHTGLAAGAAKYYDLGTIADTDIPDGFNGSAIITASGNVVASVMELEFNGFDADAFEGVSAGATTVFMPSAFCGYFGLQSAYAVQNIGNAATTVEVSYRDASNTELFVQGPVTVAPGAKANFNGCPATGPSFPAGQLGSAVVTSGGQPIVAIGKAFGAGYTTAYVGAVGGADTLALPYIRWTQASWVPGGKQRTFIAIQNVGTTTVSGATVEYRDKNGTLVVTHNLADIAPGGKVNSDPFNFGNGQAEFGYYEDGTFGGGAIIRAADGSQLTAIVRVVGLNGAGVQNGEDYSGVPIE